MNIVGKQIKEFMSKDTNVSDVRQAVLLLRRSGFLGLVRKLGFPSVINNGSDLNAMAHEGSWSNGFQTGLNQLENFEDLFVMKEIEGQHLTTPTFGGAAIAKREGYLSPQEIEKITDKGKKK